MPRRDGSTDQRTRRTRRLLRRIWREVRGGDAHLRARRAHERREGNRCFRRIPKNVARSLIVVRRATNAALHRRATHARARSRGHHNRAALLEARRSLSHRCAHKINNALGQVLLAKQMGKARIIAETGAGQHGVATATACALLGLPCDVFMGASDVERQAPNVARMTMLGARVIPVTSGSKTLKDAMNEALRDWVTNVGDHVLLHRIRGRPTSLSGARGALSIRHRRRGARANSNRDRRAAQMASSRASAADRMRSECFAAFLADDKRRAFRSRSGGARRSHRQARRDVDGRDGRACSTARSATCSRTKKAKCKKRIRSARASIIPASAPQHSHLERHGARALRVRDR